MKLLLQAVLKFILGVLMVAFLLFLPAQTLAYWNAWIFLGLLFIPMLLAGIVLLFHNPELLQKRLKAKENQKEQRKVIALSGLMFLAGFILAGLNYRYQWWILPRYIVILSSIVFVLAYLLYAEVLRENTYLSRTIEVQKNQKVVDTGLYGIVRHPMYAASFLLFLAMPCILGSGVSIPVFLLYPFLIAKRIANEEKVLEKDLEGYVNYKKKVKYRMIPGIW